MSTSQPGELRVYFSYITGLLVPGRRVLMFTVHVTAPDGHFTGWTDEELALVVEEGRRQIDRQNADLAEIRNRAQFVVTSGLAVIGLILAGTRTVIQASAPLPFVFWISGFACAAIGVLGATAVIVARKVLGMIDAAALTWSQRPVLPVLAAAYGRVVRDGENTMATAITVYRDATVFVLAAVGLYAVAWASAVA